MSMSRVRVYIILVYGVSIFTNSHLTRIINVSIFVNLNLTYLLFVLDKSI